MAIERDVSNDGQTIVVLAGPPPMSSSNGGGGGGGGGSSKKNNVMGRPALACERCKRRKIKCDAIRPTCGKCIKMKTQCIYSEAAEHQMTNPAKKRKRNKRSTQSSTAPDDDRHGSPSTTRGGSFASRSMSSDLDHHVNDNDLDAAFLLTNLAHIPGTGPAALPPRRDPYSPTYPTAAAAYPSSYAPSPPPHTTHYAATAEQHRAVPVTADRLLPQPFSRNVQFGPLSGVLHDRSAAAAAAAPQHHEAYSEFPIGRIPPHMPRSRYDDNSSSLKRSRSRSPSPVRTVSRNDGADTRSSPSSDAYAPGDRLRPLMPWPVAAKSEYTVPKRLSDAAPSMCTTSSSTSREDEHAVTPHGVHSHWLTVLDGPAPRSPSPRETAIVSPASPGPWSPSGGGQGESKPDIVEATQDPRARDFAEEAPSHDDPNTHTNRPRSTSYTSVAVSQDRIDLGKLGKLEQGDRAVEAGAVPIKQISQGPHQSWEQMVLYCM